MRIILIGINFSPEVTGVGKYNGELAEYLVGVGHHIRVITAPPYYPNWRVQPSYRWYRYYREEWGGVELLRAPLWVPKTPSGFKRILHLLSFALSSFPLMVGSVFWKPDAIITIAPSLFNAPAAMLAARLSGARSWLHVQDFELDAAVNLGMVSSGSPITKLMKGFERRILRQFDRVSTISNRMVDLLHEKGVDPERTILFPNWVDTAAVFPLLENDLRISEMKRDLGLPDHRLIALYSGNMGRKQGLEIILEAARILADRDDLFFVLCGEGAARRELQEAGKDLGNVVLGLMQPLEKLNALLNTADIHLLPQRADAADLVMPSKLSGMLASGRPVIATADPGTELAEVVSRCGVVVPPGDSTSLAGAVRELADAPEKRRMLGSRGRSWVEEHWSREAVLGGFLEELETLVNFQRD